jgi:nitronate monooxygenase
MRNAAGKAGESELQSLWAGQGLGLIRRLPAAELVRRLVAETAEIRRRVAG